MQFAMKTEERQTFILFFPTRLLRRFGAVPVIPMMSVAKGGSGPPEMTILQSQDVLVSLLRKTLGALSCVATKLSSRTDTETFSNSVLCSLPWMGPLG